jgi:hypothetical protein
VPGSEEGVAPGRRCRGCGHVMLLECSEDPSCRQKKPFPVITS